MNVSDAVERRSSTRAFKPDPVSGTVIRELLEAAKRAPSGGNLQPWRVYALAGAALNEFKEKIAAQIAQGIMGETPEYDVYPKDLWEPFRRRRRETGAQRYAAIGVGDKDTAGQRDLLIRNFQFFGAPVGLFFCLDRRLGPPQWSDMGMYMQTLMLLAVERGLSTCPQEVWANWPKTIADYLQLPAEQMVFAGMSLGYGDENHPLNQFRTARESLEDFACLLGFEA
jgi:nitroreductase